jgi:hypothetical protein
VKQSDRETQRQRDRDTEKQSDSETKRQLAKQSRCPASNDITMQSLEHLHSKKN